MNTATKMIVVLTLIATLSGGILAAWDRYTRPPIQQHRLEALQAAIAEVLPPHESYEQISTAGMVFYVGKTAAEPVGVAFAATGNGFQGAIVLMVGVTPDFSRLTGIKVLEQLETPGLGTKIVEDPTDKAEPFWFTQQFRDRETGVPLVVTKNVASEVHEIRAVTGATISSRAVVKIVNDTIARAQTIYQALPR